MPQIVICHVRCPADRALSSGPLNRSMDRFRRVTETFPIGKIHNNNGENKVSDTNSSFGGGVVVVAQWMMIG